MGGGFGFLFVYISSCGKISRLLVIELSFSQNLWVIYTTTAILQKNKQFPLDLNANTK